MVNNLNKKIGIIGAGQLAQLLAHRAYQLGIKILCFADNNYQNPPAALLSDVFYGDLNNQDDLKKFSDQVDFITIENENIDIKTLEFLLSLKKLYPSIKSIKAAQDRLLEKQLFTDLNINLAKFLDISDLDKINNIDYGVNGDFEGDSESDSESDFYNNFNQSILKTRTLGYDGKGQVRISLDNKNNKNIIANAFNEIGSAPAVLEKKIDFVNEISQISARDIYGNIVHYPIIENHHEDGILRESFCKVKDEFLIQNHDKLSELSQKYITDLLNNLDYVGVLALELFVLPDCSILANEMAPRVHNSGHLTNEAFYCGQFEMHLRAVSGEKVFTPKQICNAKMVNLIGDIKPEDYNLSENYRVYDYGKDFRSGRKVGHKVLRLFD